MNKISIWYKYLYERNILYICVYDSGFLLAIQAICHNIKYIFFLPASFKGYEDNVGVSPGVVWDNNTCNYFEKVTTGNYFYYVVGLHLFI